VLALQNERLSHLQEVIHACIILCGGSDLGASGPPHNIYMFVLNDEQNNFLDSRKMFFLFLFEKAFQNRSSQLRTFQVLNSRLN